MNKFNSTQVGNKPIRGTNMLYIILTTIPDLVTIPNNSSSWDETTWCGFTQCQWQNKNKTNPTPPTPKKKKTRVAFLYQKEI